jgi:signal transduction histidine kinase
MPTPPLEGQHQAAPGASPDASPLDPHRQEESLSAGNVFLAMMSHELRTPLQVVLGYASLLLDANYDPLTCEQRADIIAIQHAAQRMARLVDQILDLSRLEAGRLDLSHVHVDLTKALRQVLQDAMPLAAARGLDLRIARNAPRVKVIGDPERVHQILLNLVGNAIKFTDQGWVQVSVQPRVDTVDILVADSGIGISPAAQSEIFDEFFQVSHGLSRRYGGAGLGLAISKRLAHAMGGEISVQSQLGKGSVFTLRLPIAQPARER